MTSDNSDPLEDKYFWVKFHYYKQFDRLRMAGDRLHEEEEFHSVADQRHYDNFACLAKSLVQAIDDLRPEDQPEGWNDF